MPVTETEAARESKYTPLPLKRSERCGICDADGILICTVHGGESYLSERINLIIRAANNHRGLLAVCEALVEAHHFDTPQTQAEAISAAYDLALAAIAKVKGGTS